ncbi:hypothetical protein NKJ26_15310 [Mesorhizobium sp. M0152]|uniref:M15 family metallopeptidase n=1 Tax=Mesorhizobium sp. M0152 TaxID=2956898 RepID=UPI003337D152
MSLGSALAATTLVTAIPLPANANALPICCTVDVGTLDFGTGFDCFDPMSETVHRPFPGNAAANRKLLVDAMRAGGFKNYAREWCHFTLEHEPFANRRFDFPVTAG